MLHITHKNNKKFILTRPLTLMFQKRFYPTKSLVTTNVIKKILTPQLLAEQAALLRNKAIFHRYCEHFKQYPLCDLLNDKIFIQHMHDCVHKEPSLYSRAFQLALEVTYAKRKFSVSALQEIYKHDFIIEDTFNINKGLCDHSTVYTSILAKKVVDYFNMNSNDILVHSTPLFLTKEKITNTMQVFMEENKRLTDNTCPDITLTNRPYDFKEHKDISYSKNHIYFLDMDVIAHKGFKILYQLEHALITSVKAKQLSEESVVFTQKIIKILQEQRNVQTTVEMVNSLLVKSNVPKDFKMPLFIPVKKALIEVLDQQEVEIIPLNKGHLDYVKAKKAIMGILELYEPRVKNNIQDVTHNSIQFNLPNIEEVD